MQAGGNGLRIERKEKATIVTVTELSEGRAGNTLLKFPRNNTKFRGR